MNQAIEIKPDDLKSRAVHSRVLDMLQSIPIFGGVSESTIKEILIRAKILILEEDEFLFHQNDPTSSFYLLIEGKLAVIKHIDSYEYEICQLGCGDCVGELGFIDMCPRTASVKALSNCQIIEISTNILHQIYRIDAQAFTMIYMNLGREISRRMRKFGENMLSIRKHEDTTGTEPSVHKGED